MVLSCFTLPSGVLALAALIVAIVATLGAFWAPAMAMLSDAAEASGLDQGLAAALINLAWAGGQIIGAVAGGGLAKTAGDALPMLITGGLGAATFGLLLAGAYGMPE